MNRTVRILAWAVAGVVLTGGLTAVAVAVAGHDIATPVRPLGLTTNRPEQSVQEPSEPREGPTHDLGSGGDGAQTGDDQGGDATSGSNSAPGSGDSGGSDEGSGDSGGDHDGDGGDDDD